MDRIKLLNILQKLLDLYLKNELSEKKILLTIKDFSNIETNLNLVPYKETEIVYYIFLNIPYYKINDELEEFKMLLYSFGQRNSSLKSITNLLKAYLEDLEFIIQNRINTEINLHIYEMATTYFLNLKINDKLYAKKILENVSHLEEMIGMSIASNIEYTQLTLPGIIEEEINLREDISKHSCNIKLSIERQLLKALRNNYNEKNYDDFMKTVLLLIEKIKQNNNNQGILLHSQFSNALLELKQKVFAPKKAKNINSMQIHI